MRRRLLPLVFWLAGALAATAQTDTATEPLLASLVADRVSVDAERRLIAEGNVEVFYDGARLTASRITYDRAANEVLIDGPSG
jgi:LPS-assembly protein